jgi:hypothetical protein
MGMIPGASTSTQFAQTINEDFRWLANSIRDADVKVN